MVKRKNAIITGILLLILTTISISSGIREDTIKVDQSNGKMDIKFDAVELEVVDSIELMMNQAFGDTVRVDSTSIIDKPTRMFAYYIIIITTVSLILVSLLMIIMNSVLILKSRI